MRRLRERLTFANVTASLALFIALGGTSYAAITLPRNSVGTNQLRTGAIRSVDVKDRSLEARDLSLKARSFLKSQRGAQGARGPEGPQGERGPQGIPGTGGDGTSTLSLTEVRQAGTVGTAPAGGSTTATATATCPAGRKATGGGLRVDVGSDVSVRESYPNLNSTAWTAVVGNDDDNAGGSFTVFAICAPAS
jgi:hypothetical protein